MKITVNASKRLRKPVLVAPFGQDSDEEDAQPSSRAGGAEVRPPQDAGVRDAADKLAEFVASKGRQFEAMTRDRNPGDTPFRFLHDMSSCEYKYYNAKVLEHEAKLASFATSAVTTTAAAAIMAASEGPPEEQQVEAERIEAEKALAAGDKLAAMEAFMKLAAKKDKLAKLDEDELEERRRKARPESVLLNETAYDRRRVTAVFRDDGRKGHHMQDFIPPEELAKVLAKSGDTAAAQAVEAKTVIDSSNIGHKLLKKMGWSEGKGLGSTQAATAITAPVQAASMKQDQQGLGAGSTSQAGAEDPFESYRQRMMLGYKHRPNPLGNPRKSYY
ncbi:hypothetical protein V8C86DRAFT_3020239 [Haematococcus lacustris]